MEKTLSINNFEINKLGIDTWLPLVDMFLNHEIDVSYVSISSLEMLVGVKSM